MHADCTPASSSALRSSVAGKVDLVELGRDIEAKRPRIEPGAEQQHLGTGGSVGADEGLDSVVDVAGAQADHVLQRLVGPCRGHGSVIDDEVRVRIVDQPLRPVELGGEHAAGGDQCRATARTAARSLQRVRP